MAVKALSYIGVNSDKLEDWSDYSEKCLGMQRVDRGKGALSFRMDDHKQRLAIIVYQKKIGLILKIIKYF